MTPSSRAVGRWPIQSAKTFKVLHPVGKVAIASWSVAPVDAFAKVTSRSEPAGKAAR